LSTSERRRKPQVLKVEGKIFTGVSSFKHLGNIINNGNRNDNCVKETGPTSQILVHLKARQYQEQLSYSYP
jgi:hypothetical protein